MIRLRLSCDGTWPVGPGTVSCSGALSLPTLDETAARLRALDHGWTADPQAGDLCPAHSRRRQEER